MPLPGGCCHRKRTRIDQLRLLLVEDEDGIADHLVRALGQAGYAVDRAAEGDEAHFLGETDPTMPSFWTLGCRDGTGSRILRSGRGTDRPCRC